MLIFLDTEFTDFVDTQLISIGLVAENNQQFYAELNDFELKRCSAFVEETILPQLGKTPASIMSSKKLTEELRLWLAPFEIFNPVICYDFEGDWLLFQSALQGNTPPWLKHQNVYSKIDTQVAQQFFSDNNFLEHHSLHDAMANRAAYKSKT